MYIEIRAAYSISPSAYRAYTTYRGYTASSILQTTDRAYGIQHTWHTRNRVLRSQSIQSLEHTAYTEHLAKITYTTYTYQSISRTANTGEEIKRRQHRAYTVGIAYNIQSIHHTD